jgi:hypothetical protein
MALMAVSDGGERELAQVVRQRVVARLAAYSGERE